MLQPEAPRTLVPYESNDDVSGSVLGNVFEPLIAMDADLRLVPALAHSWYTPDETTWVFSLRAGARWHDGTAVTAAQVAQSLERARSDAGSNRRPELAPVAAIEATASGEIVLHTRAPSGALASQIAQVPICKLAAAGERFPAGTGPYRIVTWTPGGDTLLAPVDSQVQPPLPQLLFRSLPDKHQRLLALAQGQAHLVPYLADEDGVQLERSQAAVVVRRRGLLTAFLALDCVRARTPYVALARNPFLDVRVRRALALAIDRQELLARGLRGHGAVLEQLVVPEAFGHAAGDVAPAADVERARALMAEAGLAAGFDVTLDYENSDGTLEPVVSVLRQQLARLGVRVLPRQWRTQELLERVEARDTSLYLMPWVGTSGDLGASAAFLLHTPGASLGTNNGGGYSNPQADALIEAAATTLDRAARLELLHRLTRLVREDVPLVPLLRRDDVYGVAPGIAFSPRLDREIRGASLRSSR